MHELVRLLQAAGPAAVHDMDDLGQRESLEVIGRICFGIKFGALWYCGLLLLASAAGQPRADVQQGAAQCRDISCPEGAAAGVRLLHDAMEELLKQLTNPLKHKLLWFTKVCP